MGWLQCCLSVTLACPWVIHSLFIVVHSCDCNAANTSIVTAILITLSYMNCHFPSNAGVVSAACTELQVAVTPISVFMISTGVKWIIVAVRALRCLHCCSHGPEWLWVWVIMLCVGVKTLYLWNILRGQDEGSVEYSVQPNLPPIYLLFPHIWHACYVIDLSHM